MMKIIVKKLPTDKTDAKEYPLTNTNQQRPIKINFIIFRYCIQMRGKQFMVPYSKDIQVMYGVQPRTINMDLGFSPSFLSAGTSNPQNFGALPTAFPPLLGCTLSKIKQSCGKCIRGDTWVGCSQEQRTGAIPWFAQLIVKLLRVE